MVPSQETSVFHDRNTLKELEYNIMQNYKNYTERIHHGISFSKRTLFFRTFRLPITGKGMDIAVGYINSK